MPHHRVTRPSPPPLVLPVGGGGCGERGRNKGGSLPFVRTLSLTPSHPHHILFHPLVEGVVGACHSGDVETLQATLSEHLELDITLITEGGITPSSAFPSSYPLQPLYFLPSLEQNLKA